jgi:hypothetical protein
MGEAYVFFPGVCIRSYLGTAAASRRPEQVCALAAGAPGMHAQLPMKRVLHMRRLLD